MHLANLDKPEKAKTRDGYGKGVVELAEENPDIVVLTGDLADSTRAQWFKDKFPDRFIEVGIAEQNMIGIASGLALNGKIPFCSSYAVFCPGRAWDQTRVSVCYAQANVKIAGAHAGISVGPDGATHQALEDVASMRCIPNLVVVVPCDTIEAKKTTKAVAAVKGPCYFRFGRADYPVVTTEKTPFKIGRAEVYREGKDVALVACGPLVYEALMAAKLLEKEGIDATVINNHTVKPIDRKTLAKAARMCGCIVTAEEHQINGGMGSAVMEVLAEDFPVPVERIGMFDRFGESGTPDELLDKYGMRAKDIVRAARRALKRKFDQARDCGPMVCPPPAGMPGAKAEQLLRPVAPPATFKVSNGAQASSLQELHQLLLTIDKETFDHHVSEEHNDFATWVRDVFKDVQLADTLRRHKSRASLARALGVRIGQLYALRGNH